MNLIKEYRLLESTIKRNLLQIFISYFFILFTYPIMRSLASTYFIESYGSKEMPLSWLYAIGLLAITISIMNKLLPKVGVKKIFTVVSLISLAALALPYFSSLKAFRFFLFIWKEVYIVVLIHSFLAYTNSYFKLDDFKNWLGPIAGAGSLGGIIGGFVLSGFVRDYGMGFAFILGGIGLLLPSLLFNSCAHIDLDHEHKKPRHPLKAISGVGYYVMIIGLMVTFSQFVINIADYKFHIIFEKSIESNIARTEFLGKMYGTINIFSLIAQFIVMPLLMRKFSAWAIHFVLPLSYMATGAVGFVFGGAQAAAGTFIVYKGSDYSFFSMAKELLYHPLENIQKFGAKYINDMFIYRLAKAIIAGILIYIADMPMVIDLLFATSLVLWFLMTILLKSEFRKVKKESHHE